MAAAVIATTAVADNFFVMGDLYTGIFTVAFSGASGTYPTGGYPVTAATFGLNKLAGMEVIAGNTAGLAVDVYYDSQVGAIKMLGTTAATIGLAPNQELAATVQITGFSYTVRVWGQR